MKRRLIGLALGVVVAGTSACIHRTPAQQAQDAMAPRTYVQVEDQAFLDANVYVIAGGQRQRLGTVTGSSSKVLEIPKHLVFGPTSLSFQIDFIGSQRTPISESVVVTPGDTVVLRIPPR